MLQIRAQTAIGQYIHASAEKLLNVLLEGDDIEQRSARLNVDEEIDVAVFMVITARDRAEHPDMANAVTSGAVQDFATVTAEPFKPHASNDSRLGSCRRTRGSLGQRDIRGGGGIMPDSNRTTEVLS
jgi:hypothetical protein